MKEEHAKPNKKQEKAEKRKFVCYECGKAFTRNAHINDECVE
jgi:hypothetical protein